MGPEELVLCLQQDISPSPPSNKYLTKYLHVSPLVAGAMLTYFFFEEKLHFFV